MTARTNVVATSAFGRRRFRRLDAEFVDGRELQFEHYLKQSGGSHLADIATGYAGPVVRDDMHAESEEVRYVDIDSVDQRDGLTLPDAVKFGERPSRAKYVLREGDILIANVRPNRGVATWVGKHTAGALGSSGFTLVAPTESSLSSLTLYAFLRSASATRQLLRRNRGSMYPAVLPRDVFDIVVPRFPEPLMSRVSDRVAAGLDLHCRFFEEQDALQAKVREWLALLGAPPSPLEPAAAGRDISIVSSARMLATEQRIDAEFFRHAYDAYHETLTQSWPYFRLGEHFTLSAGRRRAGTDPVPTLKQRVLSNYGVNWSAVVHEPGDMRVTDVRDGDILLASTAHEIEYVGRRVDVVRAVPAEVASSNQAVAELMILRPGPSLPEHIPPSFVAAFLRDPAGRYQVQRCIRGLRGGHTYPRDLAKHVLVPDPGAAWLEEFETLAAQAEASRREADVVISEAVAEVEEFATAVGSGRAR